jgi:hypothetical protein
MRAAASLPLWVLLNRPLGVGEERPHGADRQAELLGLVMGGAHDRRDLRVRDGDLRMSVRIAVLLAPVAGRSEPS